MGQFSGRVIKAGEADRFLLFVAYSATKMPLRGADGYIDLASPRVLEKACWRYAENGMKTGLWHEPGHGDEFVVKENYIYRNDVPWVVKDAQGEPTGDVVHMGDWVVGGHGSKRLWRLYKAGLIGGASPQGAAGRRLATPESLARVGAA